jgi:hypothetical protein
VYVFMAGEVAKASLGAWTLGRFNGHEGRAAAGFALGFIKPVTFVPAGWMALFFARGGFRVCGHKFGANTG